MSDGVARAAEMTGGIRPPGMYRRLARQRPDALCRELVAAGWSCHVLDGRGLTGARELFDRCAAALSFPAWFGRNWDALADCLTDLSWLPGQGHVLLWEHYGVLAVADARVWRTAYDVITAAVRTRQEIGAVPLYVLVSGRGPALTGG